MGNDKIIDVDVSVTRNKRFRIDGDDDRIIELNTSDMTILNRINDADKKLRELADYATFDVEDTAENQEEAITKLINTDKQMREIIDYLFNSKVADICAPNGSMYDPFNGKYRFEHILETLFALYEKNINDEYKKMKKNVEKHTNKYIGK